MISKHLNLLYNDRGGKAKSIHTISRNLTIEAHKFHFPLPIKLLPLDNDEWFSNVRDKLYRTWDKKMNLSEASSLATSSIISASAAESLCWQAASASLAAFTLNSRLCSSRAFFRTSACEWALRSDSFISIKSLEFKIQNFGMKEILEGKFLEKWKQITTVCIVLFMLSVFCFSRIGKHNICLLHAVLRKFSN